MPRATTRIPPVLWLFFAIGCAQSSDITSANSAAIDAPIGYIPTPCGLSTGGDIGAEPTDARWPLCTWALGADAVAIVRMEGLRTYTAVTSLKNSAPGAPTELVDCAGGFVGPAWVLEVTLVDCWLGDCPVGRVDVHFGFGHDMGPSPAVLPDGTLWWYDNMHKRHVLPPGSYVGMPLRRASGGQLWSLYGMNLFGWNEAGVVWFDEASPSVRPDVADGTLYSELAGAVGDCAAAAADEERAAARDIRETATGNAYFTHAALCSFEGN